MKNGLKFSQRGTIARIWASALLYSLGCLFFPGSSHSAEPDQTQNLGLFNGTTMDEALPPMDKINSKGDMVHTRLVRRNHKYALIQIEETSTGKVGRRNKTSLATSPVSVRAKVGDHLMVALKPGASEQQLREVALRNNMCSRLTAPPPSFCQ